MGEDITDEVRERLEDDSEVHQDSDGSPDPLFTVDSGEVPREDEGADE